MVWRKLRSSEGATQFKTNIQTRHWKSYRAMPPFGVRIKLKTTGKGYVSSPFLLLWHGNITVITVLKWYFVLENRGLSTAPFWRPLTAIQRWTFCSPLLNHQNAQPIQNFFVSGHIKSIQIKPMTPCFGEPCLSEIRYKTVLPVTGSTYGMGNETWPHGIYWKGAPFCRPLPIIIISLNSKKYFSKLHISYWQKQKSWYNECIRLSERYVCKEIKCRTRIFLWCPTEYLIWNWSRESLLCTAVCFATVMRIWHAIRHAALSERSAA